MFDYYNYTYLHYKIEHTVCGAEVVAVLKSHMWQKVTRHRLSGYIWQLGHSDCPPDTRTFAFSITQMSSRFGPDTGCRQVVDCTKIEIKTLSYSIILCYNSKCESNGFKFYGCAMRNQRLSWELTLNFEFSAPRRQLANSELFSR